MSKTLDIFTPTYNRSSYLKRLYQSLVNQSDKNFKWLIVDDGSTDDTEDVVNSFINEKIIDITYIKKENEGKISTFPVAISKSCSDYLCCIDSDDYLDTCDIRLMLSYILLQEKSDSIGLVFPRKSLSFISKKFEDLDKKMIDIMDLKFLKNYNLETTIIFKKSILEKVDFSFCKGEKFVSEEIYYNKMASIGKFFYINIPIVYSEYVDGGLTNNLYKNYYSSYNSAIILFTSRYSFLKKYDFKIRFINIVKSLININALCIARKLPFYKYTPNLLLSIGLMPVSIVWRLMKYD